MGYLLDLAKQAEARFKGATAPAPTLASAPRQPSYAFPWPDQVPALGSHHVGPFELCADCGRGSWVRYGTTVLCLKCALSRVSSQSHDPSRRGELA